MKFNIIYTGARAPLKKLFGLDSPSKRIVPASNIEYDADAQAYFTAYAAAEGSELSPTKKLAFNNLVLDGKANGWWANCPKLIPAHGSNINSVGINARVPGTLKNNYIGGPAYDGDTGVTYDGISQYARTGYIASAQLMDQFNYAKGVYFLIAPVKNATNKDIISASVSASQRILMYGNRSTDVTGAQTAGALTVSGNAPSNNTIVTVRRITNTDFAIVTNGMVGAVVGTLETVALPNIEDYEGARNSAGAAVVFCDCKIFMSHWFNSGITDAEIIAFHAAVATYKTAIGL